MSRSNYPLSIYSSRSNTFSANLGGNDFPLAPYRVLGDRVLFIDYYVEGDFVSLLDNLSDALGDLVNYC